LPFRLPLPWLKEPLQVFHREDFTITMGQIIAAAIILTLTWVNCRGIRQGTIIQNLFTITKICSLAAVVLIGFSVGLNMSTRESKPSKPMVRRRGNCKIYHYPAFSGRSWMAGHHHGGGWSHGGFSV